MSNDIIPNRGIILSERGLDMEKWDDGDLGNNALKNQFAAYLQVAIRHSRIIFKSDYP